MIDYTPPPAIIAPSPKPMTEDQFYKELIELIHSIIGDQMSDFHKNIFTLTAILVMAFLFVQYIL